MASRARRHARFVWGKFTKRRSEWIRSLAHGSSRWRSPGRKFERNEPVGCASGGYQPFQSRTRWRRSRRSLSLGCPIPELRATGRRPELAVGIPRRCARLWRFNPESTGVEVSTCPIFMRLKESHTLTAKPRAARQRQELAGPQRGFSRENSSWIEPRNFDFGRDCLSVRSASRRAHNRKRGD